MGSKTKQVIYGKYEQKNRITGEVREIFVTRPAERPPCKGCGGEPRREGSAFGEKCANQKRVQDMNDRNMKKRIALQAKSNGNEENK